MDFHPVRCVAEAACLVSVGATVFGWLPVVLASAASLAAAIYYFVAVYDRFKKGPTHHGQPYPRRRSTD